MTIRDARLSDLPTIVDFNLRLALESEDKRLDPSTVERGVRRALNSTASCQYFVAEETGAVIGQTMVTYELTDWRDGVFWWIQSVYVVPEARGRGIFRALFEHIDRLAHDSPEVRGIRLYVERHNATAISTYERLGLQPSGHLLYEIDWS